MTRNPIVLCILDGWGHRSEQSHNAIFQAKTPTWDHLWSTYPHSLLNASAHAVGLPQSQMGNSEVGHMTIGTGRVLYQDLLRIDHAISDNQLDHNKALLHLVATLKKTNGHCHLAGLLSDGGVHSHQNHVLALCHFFQKHNINVFLHAFLDGRDTAPQSAAQNLEAFIEQLPRNTKLASFCGRYFAMDRDKRWERTKTFYDAFTSHDHEEQFIDAAHLKKHIESFYRQNIFDEFIPPIFFKHPTFDFDVDALVCFNFRADRMRQLLSSLITPDFASFNTTKKAKHVYTMTRYSDAFDPYVNVLFEPDDVSQSLGEIIANHNFSQLRIAETEKYAHVTFFFNAGREEPFSLEDRILIPSPKVATYDLQPEMSAFELKEQLTNAISSQKYQLIVANFANADMVGHTGNLSATKKAIETIDLCLNDIFEACKKTKSTLIITADHGNAEMLFDTLCDDTHTAHTCNPVPFVIASEPQIPYSLSRGSLADIAPTILDLLNIPQPDVMSGHSLIKKEK